MAKNLTGLCTSILKENFGNVVAAVGVFLLNSTPSSLFVIRQKVGEKPDLVSYYSSYRLLFVSMPMCLYKRITGPYAAQNLRGLTHIFRTFLHFCFAGKWKT